MCVCVCVFNGSLIRQNSGNQYMYNNVNYSFMLIWYLFLVLFSETVHKLSKKKNLGDGKQFTLYHF